MKFLIHGNAPFVKTGYGVQCAHIARALQADGHEVAVSSTYGANGSIQNWDGIRIYPPGLEMNSNDRLPLWAAHWFGKEPGVIITLTDVWAINAPGLEDRRVVAWTPIDHVRVPPGVLQFFGRTLAIPAAMSRFAERELRQALAQIALTPVYIPLSVDTNTYKPTPTIEHEGESTTARKLHQIPDDAFLVGMVAMNKGWTKDRKGFSEAFWAFGQFIKTHPDAILYVHAEVLGLAEGINLHDLRAHAGIPEENIRFAHQAAYAVGYTDEMMAGLYSDFDVLLAPSHGEGFCVPMIEAQACGTPVIATAATAQKELIGAGWSLDGQPEWDPAQHAPYVTPFVADIIARLEDAYTLPRSGRREMARRAIKFAKQYDTRVVWENHWRPFLTELLAEDEPNDLRDPIPHDHAAAVLCPVLNRPDNVRPLVESFRQSTREGEALLYFIVDLDDTKQREAVEAAVNNSPEYVRMVTAETGPSFAQKLNDGLRATTEPWLLVIGDDVRFHDGWLDATRKVSDRFDVIGTNDTAGPVKNPKVASGAHADHFFVRRAYVDEHGACLDGPGILAPEAYKHWYTDMEIVGLAKARGVFTPCFESIVEHLQPGYDGREDLRQADPTYMLAVANAETDHETWLTRVPLIEMQRIHR